jgi:hypothetical protein
MLGRCARTIPLLAVLGAAALVGCGGDDETSTDAAGGATQSGGAQLNARAFAKQANAICAAGNDELEQLTKETFTGQEPTRQQLNTYTDTAISTVQRQVKAIQALQPSDKIADQVNEFLDSAESDVAEVRANPAVLAGGDTNPFAHTTQLARDLGITECGSSN